MSPRHVLTLALLLIAFPSFAVPDDEDDDIQQSVARIAFLSGSASYCRGDDPDSWQQAPVNLPLTVGDRLYTGNDGRAEVQVSGTGIYLAPGTQLTALELRDGVSQLSVTIGTASFRVRRLAEDEIFEVGTPNVSVTLKNPGLYRVDVGANGDTRISLFDGAALAVAAGGQLDIVTGEAVDVEGIDEPRYDVMALPNADSWDRWVEDRARRRATPVSVQYAHEDIVGIDDLDEDGRWEDVPDYGWAWSPRTVSASWAPYRDGRWIWQDPWGWTWVSSERWGWAPYHYGSWISHRSRWFWVPIGRGARPARYSPARVVFTGGGPREAEYVGWFPIAPRDLFIPWWGRHARDVRDTSHVRYGNHGTVTVVRRNTFVSCGYVRDAHIRDTRIIRDVSAGRFFLGALPFVPTVASIRFTTGPRHVTVVRPGAAFLGRPVVTRLAPPLAPPSFSVKVGHIRSNGGMPVGRVDSDRLSIDHYRGSRSVVAIRPSVSVGGAVQFTPKRDFGGRHVAQPVIVPQGRTFSTHERPVSSPFDHRSSERPSMRESQRPSERPAMRESQRSPERPVMRESQREPRSSERPAMRESQREPRSSERPAMRESQSEPRSSERPAMRESRSQPRSSEQPAMRESQREPRSSERPAMRESQSQPRSSERPATRESRSEPRSSERPAVRESQSQPSERPSARQQQAQPKKESRSEPKNEPPAPKEKKRGE